MDIVLTLIAASSKRPLQTLPAGGKEKPCSWGIHVGVRFMGQAQQKDTVPILIQGEIPPIIDRAELHPVVVNHAIRCDGSVTVADQQQCSFISVHVLQLFAGGGAAVHIQEMAAADLLQIREVSDHRCLLAAERQVDQMPHIEQSVFDGGRLEFCLFLRVKAVQPFGEVVHLIEVNRHFLQPLEDRPVSADLIHPAVPLHRISQAHALEHINHIGKEMVACPYSGALALLTTVCIMLFLLNFQI